MKKKQLFYSLKNILSHDAKYNIIYGERSNGKSYAVKEYCVRHAYKTKKATFALVRRNEKDVKPSAVEDYFNDCPVASITDGEYNCITAWQGRIYLATINPETSKITKGLVIGYYFYLTGAVHYKSRIYPDIVNIIFEEFLTKGQYIKNEPDEFQDLMSTLIRRRDGKVFCIGNTVNRLNPYYREWSLHNLPHMKQFEIDDYYLDTGEMDDDGNPEKVHIAVEYCGSSDDTKKSSMFFGSHAKMINGGSWECSEHPKPPSMDFDIVYEILIKWYGLGYVCQYVIYENGNTCLYVYPYTGHRKIERVIQDEFSTDPMVTKRLFKDNEIESDMVELFRQNKMVFSDNLTGDEFINMFSTIL